MQSRFAKVKTKITWTLISSSYWRKRQTLNFFAPTFSSNQTTLQVSNQKPLREKAPQIPFEVNKLNQLGEVLCSQEKIAAF